jgi:hypothetical protein
MQDCLRNNLANIALAEVGKMEEGGNNLGEHVVEFQKATWLKPGAWPWCAAFTAWVLQQWLLNPMTLAHLKLTAGTSDKWRCKDASAFGWLKWAANKQISTYPETELAKIGDIVVYDFSHIGIVTADQPTLKHKIHAVEGNTNGKGNRDSLSGDGVWQKNRSHTLVREYIRIIE